MAFLTKKIAPGPFLWPLQTYRTATYLRWNWPLGLAHNARREPTDRDSYVS